MSSSPAVTIYERDACLDLVHGNFVPLVEFACPELDVTFNFYDQGKLRAWAGVAYSQRAVPPEDTGRDNYFARCDKRQAARHHRPGPALTDAQAAALRRLLKLKARLAEAEAAANDAFGTEFRLLVPRAGGADDVD